MASLLLTIFIEAAAQETPSYSIGSGPGSLLLTWDRNPESSVVDYLISYMSTQGVENAEVGVLAQPESPEVALTITGLEEGVSYAFWARARDGTGCVSKPSLKVSAVYVDRDWHAYLRGDILENDRVDCADAIAALNSLADKPVQGIKRMNADGRIDIGDVIYIVQFVADPGRNEDRFDDAAFE